jgi:peptide/nickel transport system substrate-binding protein
MVGSLIFSYLTSDGPRGERVADVALSVPSLANGGVSRDGLHLTYHLRHDVKWQDGYPLTAADCIFTFHAIENAANAIPSRNGYDDVASIAAPDPFTLRVNLRRRAPSVLANFLALDGNYAIMPAHLLGRYASLNQIDFNEHPVGSGPYRVITWMHGDYIALEANARYFRGVPKVARLEMRFIPQTAALLDELRTKEIDAAFSLDPSVYDTIRTVSGVRLVLTPVTGMGTIILNTATGPTRDRRVREAVALALNVPLIVKNASHGAFVPGNARLAILGLAADRTSAAERDPPRARRLLDAAGWHVGAGGFRARDGARLTMTLAATAGSPLIASAVTIVQAQLAEIGIDAVVRMYSTQLFGAAVGPLFSGRFELAIAGLTVGNDHDTGFLYSCAQRPPVGFNISRLCDSHVDDLERDVARTYDPAQRLRSNVLLEQALERDVPEIVLWQPRRLSVFTDRLRGFAPAPVTPYTNSWRWSLQSR